MLSQKSDDSADKSAALQLKRRIQALEQENASLRDQLTEIQTQRMLQEHSQLQYSTLFEHTHDGVAVFEYLRAGGRRLIDCNEGYVRASGRSRDLLLQMKDIESCQVHEMTAEERERVRHNYFEGEGYRGVYSWIRDDGRDNWVEYRTVPVRLGERLFVYTIERDITDSVLLGKELEKTRSRQQEVLEHRTRQLYKEHTTRLREHTLFSQMIDHLPLALFTLARDNTGRIFVRQPQGRLAESLGLKRTDGQGRCLLQSVFDEAVCESLMPCIQQAFEGSHVHLSLLTQSDCYELWLESVTAGEEDAQLVGSLIDISERRRVEMDLRKSESRLMHAQQRAQIGHMELDMSNGRMEVSTQFAQMCKLWEGQRLIDVFQWLGCYTQPSQQQFQSAINVLQHTDTPRKSVSLHFIREGVRRVHQITLERSDLGGGEALLLFGILQDITDSCKQEKKWRDMLDHEREVSRSKSFFVNMVSHEIRSPLATIRCSTDLLRRYMPPDDRTDLYMSNICLSIDRMSVMLENFMMIGRIESGKMSFSPRITDVVALLDGICDDAEQACEQPGRIKRRYADVQELWLDARLVDPALYNILTNALKYSDADQPVFIEVEVLGDQVHIEVVDKGIGIPAATQGKVFDAFHRASNTQNIEGNGLGLNIVSRCVDLHRGSVSFVSVEGEGTTFKVSLPCAKE